MALSTLDIIVFVTYCLGIVSLGLYVSRGREGIEKTSNDYFLAGNSLTWWAVGSSLIASNISAEQIVGMSGSGYAIGLGIATYELMAAATLLIVAKFFLPIFLEKKIYTMPQFLEMRFDNRVRTTLAVFWILVYIFVNLTSVLYLGSLALSRVAGVDMTYAIIGLGLFSALYSIYGGLMAVAWTDVVQVVVLVFGGIATSYFALNAVSDGQGVIAGLQELYAQAPTKFDMILEKGHPYYNDLPGISVLIGGMWIVNLSYWGFNQYITQRALAAKSLQEAQRGVIFAAYLKLFMPFIVVIPGIAAYVLEADITKNDEAYPWLLSNFMPSGLKGLAFAALIAAIVSSLSSMMNSVSTIFTVDIYKQFINKNASENRMVGTGRVVSAVALVVAMLVAPQLSTLDQAFQFIQNFTGLVSPGVFTIFVFGMFWKKATANAALWAAILTIPFGFGVELLFPGIPFIDRMGIVFILLSLLIIVLSLAGGKGNDPKSIDLPKGIFSTGPVFNIFAIGVCAILAVVYYIFW